MNKRTNRSRVVHWRLEPALVEGLNRLAHRKGKALSLFINDELSRLLCEWEDAEKNEN